MPVAGDPLPARGRLAPDAADPDEVLAGLVPAPVAGDPLDVRRRPAAGRGACSSTAFGGVLGDDQPRLRVVHHGRGERLVHRPLRQDLHRSVVGVVDLDLPGSHGPRRGGGGVCCAREETEAAKTNKSPVTARRKSELRTNSRTSGVGAGAGRLQRPEPGPVRRPGGNGEYEPCSRSPLLGAGFMRRG